MAEDAQCQEDGPFFPTTPRYVIQNGLSINQDILKAPDWIVILCIMVAVLLVMALLIIALILFRKYGWTKAMFNSPRYRFLATRYNMDDYSSKGSSVHSEKKVHRSILSSTSGHADTGAVVLAGNNESLQTDEFWDYEQQVDLEAFSAPTVYDLLSQQTRNVTRDLGQQKQQIKSLYQKIANQNESLKGLWAAKLNLSGRQSMATEEDVVKYEKKLSELEAELLRRQTLGEQWEEVLARWQHQMKQEEEKREAHQVNYQSALREAQRLLDEHVTKLQRGHLVTRVGEFDASLHRSIAARVGRLQEKMVADLTGECERTGCWGVLGQGTGATIVRRGEGVPLSRDDLIGNNSSIIAMDLLSIDNITGLIVPTSEAQMMLNSGQICNIPPGFFLHPQTGKVLPVHGNVSFDPLASKLIVTVDSAIGERGNHSEPLIPYIPHPINPNNGQPTETGLKGLTNSSDLKLGGPVPDPQTGIPAPICAVTIHPRTGEVLPVAGSHTDPITGYPVAIETGGLMLDDATQKPVPILAVTIDPSSGRVYPIGGIRHGPSGDIARIPGESFMDPLSSLSACVQGAYVNEGEVMPSAGGYQNYLNSSVMACEARVAEALRLYKDAVFGSDSLESGKELNVRHEKSILEVSVKELEKARCGSKANLYKTCHDVGRQQERAAQLASSGGCPGMYEHKTTGQLLPILVGMMMEDPGGTNLEVPILSIGRDKVTGELIPLGGTTEDPEGSGSVPITIGRKVIDPVTGELSPVIGVKLDPETNTVIPVTLASGSHRKRRPPVGALALLEDEVVARETFWRRQRQREYDMTEEEFTLAQLIVYSADGLKEKQQLKAKLDKLAEEAHALEDAAKREVQRRTDSEQEMATVLPSDVFAVLTEGDEQERKAEEAHHSAHVKFETTVRKFLEKLLAEEEKFKSKLEELEDNMNPQAEQVAKKRHDTAKARIVAEFKDQVLTKMENLDEDHSTLEYARQKSKLLAEEAMMLLRGDVTVAGNFNTSLTEVYGEVDLTSQSSNQELIPLLQQLIALLESGSPMAFSSDVMNTIQGGDISLCSSVAPTNVQPVIVSKQQTVSTTAPSGDRRKFAETVLVKSSAASSKGVGGTPMVSSQYNSTALVNPERLKQQSTSEEERKKLQRDLVTKQTYEAAKLENDLRQSEVEKINEIHKEFKDKKTELLKDVTTDMKSKLAKAKTAQDKEKIVLEYAENVQKLTDILEKKKQKQLASLRETLLERRRKSKKDLHRQHIAEAKSLGLPPDGVPDISIKSHEELDSELRHLVVEQESMAAEMEKMVAEEDAKNPASWYEEMEENIKAMKLSPEKEEEIIKSLKDHEAKGLENIENLRARLNARKNREKMREGLDVSGMSEEERNDAEDANKTSQSADRMTEDNALLKAVILEHQDAGKTQQMQILQSALKDVKDEEKQRTMQQYLDDLEKAKNNADERRNAQKDAVLAKLAARKRMREQLRKNTIVADDLNRMTEIQASKGDTASAEVMGNISNQLKKIDEDADIRKLTEEHTNKQANLQASQLKESRKAEMELESEMKKENEDIENAIELQKKLAMDDHKAKFDREMLLRGKNISEDKFQQLLANHQQEQKALEQNYNDERTRMQKNLQEKIAQRRAARLRNLEEKHAADMTNEMVTQQEERDVLIDKKAKGIENELLKESLKDKDGTMADDLIWNVLRQRHLKEAVHLEEQLDRDEDAKKTDAQSFMESKRVADRQTLVNAFEQDMLELLANTANLSPKELEEQKKELKASQEQKLVDYDKLTEQMVAQAGKEVSRGLEAEHTDRRLVLKEKHLKEIAEMMRSLNPKDALIQQYEKEAEAAAKEAANHRDNVLRQIQEETEKKKNRMEREEEEKRERMRAELETLERDLEEERIREEVRERERLEERDRTLQQQLREREDRGTEEIGKMDVSEEEKDRLMKEYLENQAKYADSMKKEQEKSRAALAAKLDARRQRKAALQKAQLDKQYILGEEAELRRAVIDRLKEEAELKQKQAAGVGSVPKISSFSSGGSEEEWVRMLMDSPLFQQINDIQETMDKNMAKQSAKPDFVIGADYSEPYIDVKDAQWRCRGKLQPVDLSDLTAGQFVVYRFGVFIIRLLHQHLKTPEVTLLLASSLPNNNYTHNAFRHSFFYEHARKILFVRRERMESIGDFVLLIIHCLSHVHVDEFKSDLNPHFLRVFYKALKLVCQDLFFSRAKSGKTQQSIMGYPASTNGRAALEAAFKVARNHDDQVNVANELVEMKVTDAAQSGFSEQALSQRLGGYEKFTSQARIRQLLSNQGGTANHDNFINARIAELKGLPPPDRTITLNRKPITSTNSIRTARDLFDSQLRDMETKLDVLNAQLLDILKEEMEFRNVSSQDENVEKLVSQRQNVMKKIAYLQQEIEDKRKAMKKAK